MKILFLSQYGSSIPLAIECKNQDNDVKFYVEDKDCKDIGNGFVPSIKEWKSSTSWADLVICDFTKWGKVNEDLRSKGIPVIGGTRLTDDLEEERQDGQDLFKAAGMDILESHDFSDMEEAIGFIKEQKESFVAKVTGKEADDSSLTYVGQLDDGRDMLYMLDHFKSAFKGKIDSVCLQKKVDGVEVALGGFFNGEEFMDPIFLNFEHKKLLPGPTSSGIGPNTGEMGTCGVWISKDESIYKQTIGRMEKILREENYHGYFDINLIVNDKIHPLEMTNRFGWPTLPLQLETLKDSDLAEFFLGMATGDKSDFTVSNPWSTCVVVGAPPFPYENDDLFEKYAKDLPVLFKEETTDGIYPADIKMENENWVMAGNVGHVAVCCGSGNDLKESQDQAYERVDNVIVPNKIYREDIGRTTEESYQSIQEQGLIGEKEEAVQ